MTREEGIDWLCRLKSEIKIFMPYQWQKPFEEALDMAIKALEQELKSFQWCHDCKEYDQDKHCCHRWSKVIRDTVEEMKQEQEPRWIPVSEVLPKQYEAVILSTDEEEIFIARYLGKMDDGTDCFDDEDGMMWEGDVTAWMPLPKPYEPQESENT